MQCPNCGKETAPPYKHCDNCGYDLATPEPRPGRNVITTDASGQITDSNNTSNTTTSQSSVSEVHIATSNFQSSIDNSRSTTNNTVSPSQWPYLALVALVVVLAIFAMFLRSPVTAMPTPVPALATAPDPSADKAFIAPTTPQPDAGEPDNGTPPSPAVLTLRAIQTQTAAATPQEASPTPEPTTAVAAAGGAQAATLPATPTSTPTATAVPTDEPTATDTATATATPTHTPTASSTPTPLPTATQTPSPSPTPTNTPSLTPTFTPTQTPRPEPFVSADGKIYVVEEGVGFAPDTITNAERRKYMAILAAELDAKSKFSGLTIGEAITRTVRSEDGTLITTTVTLESHGLLVGANTISSTYDDATRMATVLVEMPMPVAR